MNQFRRICYCRQCRGIVHKISQGDTLYSLSRRYRVSIENIMDANPYINIYNLRVGEEICIPLIMRTAGQNDVEYGNGRIESDMGNGRMQPDMGGGRMQPDMGGGRMEPDMGSGRMEPDMGSVRIERSEENRREYPNMFEGE